MHKSFAKTTVEGAENVEMIKQNERYLIEFIAF